MTMSEIIIITRANGSLAVAVVLLLLIEVPIAMLVLAVRDASSADSNTQKLRHLIFQHPKSRVSIRQLDLADLTAVHSFAEAVAAEISAGSLLALTSIIYNAHYWGLNGPAVLTKDSLDNIF